MIWGKNKTGDNLNIRTDLITEENIAEIKGIKTKVKKVDEVQIEIAEITDEQAAKSINKPCGKYCTVRFDRLDSIADTSPLEKALVCALNELLGNKNNNVLIVGLGNSDITPDALGPLCAGSVIATRHITDELKNSLGLSGLHTVSCIIPGVLGKTGIEAVDIIKATVKETAPDVVLAVDALAARTPDNLCRTVQMTDSGIAPGSGVKNERKALNRENLGVPVIALGIPTVIDTNFIYPGLATDHNMMVTPKEIDVLITRAAQITAKAINIFFQPSLDINTIESLS